MFSYTWSKKLPVNTVESCHPKITGMAPVVWREHCVECAIPGCYSTCLLYEKRIDGRCERFTYGFQRINYGDCEHIGARMMFKRWAKLEAVFPNRVSVYSISSLKKYYSVLIFFSQLLKILSKYFRYSKFLQLYEGLMEAVTIRSYKLSKKNPDFFYVEVKNDSRVNVKLIIEFYSSNDLKFKESFLLLTGWNYLSIPFEKFNFSSVASKHKLMVYIGNDSPTELEFKYLDFVSGDDPVTKIKCVAWDLDNTLWQGVIGDDGADKVIVDDVAIDLIKKLDEMGFIQTIVSKNTFDVVWPKIKELGLSEYFVYPEINWKSKSENIAQITKKLNIGMDTIAFVDDSEFERAEVISSLPMVRCYDSLDIQFLLGRCEFDIMISFESKSRRLSYKADEKRDEMFESFDSNLVGFLKSCDLNLIIHSSLSEDVRVRCYELLLRSNQYNLRTVRYSSSDFKDFFSGNDMLYALEVSDKFGNYGIVGFARIIINENSYLLNDFVMSCRVAQKKLEREFLSFLVSKMQIGSSLIVDASKTMKNEPLRNELRGMPFNSFIDHKNKEVFEYKKRDSSLFVNDKIFKINE